MVEIVDEGIVVDAVVVAVGVLSLEVGQHHHRHTRLRLIIAHRSQSRTGRQVSVSELGPYSIAFWLRIRIRIQVFSPQNKV